ncbi:metal-sensitive transcriptional regulator [Salimicrobium halophilum]|uniref:DNA-binding transcriptional regulator, FrmR family n=1 Tax=Salimicrobium halophilum TaxID=86666 RepID=A0A1G8TMK0_9BACI|nr:metal-sensitive transcriptional regulator [Salimicrobium halophilum]SDJ42762.1 DNA-binding transcriptional regulator, FrmR family [Salimicrobium halophilum]
MEDINKKSEYDQDVKNRLKRVEGQVRGVLKMMEEGKECKDVVTQLSAARSAMDRSLAYIVAKNLETCIRDAEDQGENADDVIGEAIQMLVKSR